MKYASVCHGIGASEVAWPHWECVASAQYDPEHDYSKGPDPASAVLQYHHPNTPNLGDMTRYHEWNIEPGTLDAFCGGTPCQDYSIAGDRAGMAGERGRLTGVFLEIVERLRPRWVIWENVVGVMSSNGGRDFGAFLGGLGRIGYGWSYRILDAQFTRVDGYPRAIPQRRRRVWVVAHSSGRWQYPCAVLQERQILSWSAAPRREEGERVAPTVASRTSGGGGHGTDFECDGGLIVADVQQITSKTNRSKCEPGSPAPTISRNSSLIVMASGQANAEIVSDVDTSLTCLHETPVLIRMRQGKPGGGKGALVSDDTSLTLATGNDQTLIAGSAVRSLTPIEYERLFGFPDNYTLVPYRGRMMSDTARYRMLGNSWCINQARWVGYRVDQVDAIISKAEAA